MKEDTRSSDSDPSAVLARLTRLTRLSPDCRRHAAPFAVSPSRDAHDKVRLSHGADAARSCRDAAGATDVAVTSKRGRTPLSTGAKPQVKAKAYQPGAPSSFSGSALERLTAKTGAVASSAGIATQPPPVSATRWKRFVPAWANVRTSPVGRREIRSERAIHALVASTARTDETSAAEPGRIGVNPAARIRHERDARVIGHFPCPAALMRSWAALRTAASNLSTRRS